MNAKDYVSDRVFDGIKPMSAKRAAACRAAYRRQHPQITGFEYSVTYKPGDLVSGDYNGTKSTFVCVDDLRPQPRVYAFVQNRLEFPCAHVLVHKVTMPAVTQTDGYRTVTSLNAFCHGGRRRKKAPCWSPRFLFYGQPWAEFEVFAKASADSLRSLGVTTAVDDRELPVMEHTTLWEFYKAIGYDHKKRRWAPVFDDAEIEVMRYVTAQGCVAFMNDQCGSAMAKTIWKLRDRQFLMGQDNGGGRWHTFSATGLGELRWKQFCQIEGIKQ